jgi:chromosomal replication initiator protein
VIDGVLELDLPRSDLLAVSPGVLPSFIVGPENALVIEPVRRLLFGKDLAEAARLFNPLVLVGPTGSGKSQLVQGVVRHWRRRLESQQVEYVTAADFGRQCQDAAEDKRLSAWRAHVRSLELLVIEDLQQLRPRGIVQEELRYAIDDILENGGLIVVTTQREPAMLTSLDPGLRDRLAAGLTVRVQPPGLAARQAILRLAGRTRGIEMDEHLLGQLAHRDGSPAELIGRLKTCGPLALVEMGPTEHGRPEVARAQGGSLREANGERGKAGTRSLSTSPQGGGERDRATLKQIIAVTARYFNVTQAALTGSSRRTSLVYARNIIVHLARRLTSLSYAEIGRGLGGRDHTTAMHADRRLAAQLADDMATQQAIDELDRLLR